MLNLRAVTSTVADNDFAFCFPLIKDALPNTTLFDLGGLQIELEELLGVPVDLLTPGDLSPKFRDQVLAETRLVRLNRRVVCCSKPLYALIHKTNP